MPYKKTIIFLTIILVLLAGILLAYNYFFADQPEEPTLPEVVTPGGLPNEPEEWETEIAPSPSAKIKILSQETVLSPIVDGQNIKYYLAGTGQVWQSSFDGSTRTQLSSVNLANLKQAIWSPDKNKVITVFEDEGQIKKFFYDYVTGLSVSLNDNIQWITWSPFSHKVAYHYSDSISLANKIAISDPDGSNWQNVFNTRLKDLIVEWPSENKISFRTKPSGLAQSVVYTIDPDTNDLTRVLADRYGLSTLWSPKGEKILFSETTDQGKNLSLKLADNEGRILSRLDVVTLPEKCVFSQDQRNLYCAVPKVLSGEPVLPDDYYKGLYSTKDKFWKINLETKQKSLLIEDKQVGEDIDAYKLLLSDQEDYLFFINKKDGLLYSLKI